MDKQLDFFQLLETEPEKRARLFREQDERLKAAEVARRRQVADEYLPEIVENSSDYECTQNGTQGNSTWFLYEWRRPSERTEYQAIKIEQNPLNGQYTASKAYPSIFLGQEY